jgi:membrane protease subunit HflC
MNASVRHGRNLWINGVAVLFAAALVAATCLYQVRVTEVAMISTLGRPGKPVSEPGLYGKLPWPFQRVYTFDRRVQLFEGQYREILTKDGLNLVARLYLAWQIENPSLFYEWVGFDTADSTRVLSGLLDKHSSDVLGQHALASLVSTRPKQEESIRAIEQDISQRIQAEASRYGIGVRALGFEHLGLPETVTQAVFSRMIADRERLAEKTRSEGERDAKLIRTEAERLRAEKLSAAEAEAARIRGEAESEALKQFAVFDKDPDFALFLRKLEALEQTLKEKTTLVLDRDTPPYDLLSPGGFKDVTGDAAPAP